MLDVGDCGLAGMCGVVVVVVVMIWLFCVLPWTGVFLQSVVLVVLLGVCFVVAGARCLGACFCGKVVVVVVGLGGDFRFLCFALEAMFG